MRSRTSSAGSCTNSTSVSCKWVAYLQMRAQCDAQAGRSSCIKGTVAEACFHVLSLSCHPSSMPAWSIAGAGDHLRFLPQLQSEAALRKSGAHCQADGAHRLAVAACRTAAKLHAQQLRVWTSLRTARSRYEPRKELTSTSLSCMQKVVQHTRRHLTRQLLTQRGGCGRTGTGACTEQGAVAPHAAVTFSIMAAKCSARQRATCSSRSGDWHCCFRKGSSLLCRTSAGRESMTAAMDMGWSA